MKCCISGSFKKFYKEIVEAIDAFEAEGVTVLSPKKSRIVNPGEEFTFLESDGKATIFEIEEKHLNAIRNSDFLYVVNPRSYVGERVAQEIFYARALKKPIYSQETVKIEIVKDFVTATIPPKELARHLKNTP